MPQSLMGRSGNFIATQLKSSDTPSKRSKMIVPLSSLLKIAYIHSLASTAPPKLLISLLLP